MGILRLTKDGVLPRGVHRASPADVRQLFGTGTGRRAELMAALDDALEHARKAGVRRVLINGSFVTSKKEPRDVDMVLQVSEEFAELLAKGGQDAKWIADRAKEPPPKLLDVFIAVDDEEWASWVSLFGGDAWHGKKGLVEVTL